MSQLFWGLVQIFIILSLTAKSQLRLCGLGHGLSHQYMWAISREISCRRLKTHISLLIRSQLVCANAALSNSYNPHFGARFKQDLPDPN